MERKYSKCEFIPEYKPNVSLIWWTEAYLIWKLFVCNNICTTSTADKTETYSWIGIFSLQLRQRLYCIVTHCQFYHKLKYINFQAQKNTLKICNPLPLPHPTRLKSGTCELRLSTNRYKTILAGFLAKMDSVYTGYIFSSTTVFLINTDWISQPLQSVGT